jgi:hypothetical protein
MTVYKLGGNGPPEAPAAAPEPKPLNRDLFYFSYFPGRGERFDQLLAMMDPGSDPLLGEPDAPTRLAWLVCLEYQRARRENRVAISEAGVAAFSTGLVDFREDEIFAVFDRNRVPDRQPWFFLGFAAPGQGPAGMALAKSFRPYPEPPKAPLALTDVSLRPEDGPPACNYDHILGDRFFRLPVGFLERHLPPELIPEDIPGTPIPILEGKAELVKRYLDSDKRKAGKMAVELKAAVAAAVAGSKGDRAAVPYWYFAQPYPDPVLDLLLPVSLETPGGAPDIALAVGRVPIGNLLGTTVFTLNDARNHGYARAFGPMYSGWLEYQPAARRDPLPFAPAPEPENG